MKILSEQAWKILERAEYLHDQGMSMSDIAADTGESVAGLSYLSIVGPDIRDALERAIRQSRVGS